MIIINLTSLPIHHDITDLVNVFLELLTYNYTMLVPKLLYKRIRLTSSINTT